MSNWFSESLYNSISQKFEIKKTLFEGRSDFQDVLLFENDRFGKMMALDGIVQTSTSDEHCYHEMLIHVPFFFHGNVQRVLIIGGGDGGTLREALKHKTITYAKMVEIDGLVVEQCKKHLPEISCGAFDDPRTDLLIGDGVKYMAETSDMYDVIIVDSSDPVGPNTDLFGESFYKNCKKRLNQNGILITQNGVPFLQPTELKESCAFFKSFFQDASAYLTAVPAYYGGYMALGWATDNTALRKTPLETIKERFEASEVSTRFYTPELNISSFMHPKFIKELIDAS